MPKLPWKAWHETVALREDLKSGELPLHMFAADLYEVVMQRGKRPIYEKPREFFGLTSHLQSPAACPGRGPAPGG